MYKAEGRDEKPITYDLSKKGIKTSARLVAEKVETDLRDYRLGFLPTVP